MAMRCKCFMIKCSFLLLFCVKNFFLCCVSRLSRGHLGWGNMKTNCGYISWGSRLQSFIRILIAEGALVTPRRKII